MGWRRRGSEGDKGKEANHRAAEQKIKIAHKRQRYGFSILSTPETFLRCESQAFVAKSSTTNSIRSMSHVGDPENGRTAISVKDRKRLDRRQVQGKTKFMEVFIKSFRDCSDSHRCYYYDCTIDAGHETFSFGLGSFSKFTRFIEFSFRNDPQ